MKGIDAETRAIARARAGDADLTIGAWIDQAILTHAATPGRPGDDARVAFSPGNSGKDPASKPPAVSGQPGTVSEGDLLGLIGRELDASRERLDQSLRPVGYALKDLALRLVAAEVAQRGGRPKSVPARTPMPPPQDPRAMQAGAAETEAATVTLEAPPPPRGSLTPVIDPTEIPVPPIDHHSPPAPLPPSDDLSVTITAIEPPRGTQPSAPSTESAMPRIEPDRTDSRPPPIPPTASLGTIDPAEFPTPPIAERVGGSLPLPLTAIESGLDSTVPELDPEPSADGAVKFTGLQAGFESDPDVAFDEARADTNGKTLGALRIAAGLAPFLIIGALTAGYFLADPLGIAPLRDMAAQKVTRHANAANRTLGDAYHAAIEKFDQLLVDGPVTARREVSAPAIEPPERVATVPSGDEVPRSMLPAPEPEPENNAKPKVTAPRGIVSDDPPIANLDSANKPKPKERAVAVARPKQIPQLAVAPPARPVLPEIARPPVKKPAPKTKLAALPKAPSIVKKGIPPSRLDKKALVAMLRNDARAGDPRAQHELARRLIQGDGIDQDFAAGSEWFRESAIQGVANAQYNLAVLYERGLGVTKDDVRALLWYHSAAEQSHPLAQYNLGIFYLQGRGIPLSYAEAVRWFSSASEQGIARATYNLAVLTEDGLGVPPNRQKAIALYEKAAAAGHHEAAGRLALLRDPSAADPKPATFEETANTQAEGGSTGTTVANIQAFLRKLGMYEGRIDGVAGPKTRTAIREYQRRNALPITGIPSSVLLDFMKTLENAKPSVTSASG